MNRLYILLLFSILTLQGFAQGKVLFSVDQEPVYLDEFLYIYEKTNRGNADFSEASVMEYLDLYKKFKLKVHKARQMRLDTVQSLNQELAGYRKQLANAYLSDREVTESLIKEAWERMQKEVSFSHILLKVPPTSSEQQEKKTYERALDILERLRAGEVFEKVALEVSEDQTVTKNRGKVGYVSAMLPDGFYDLETALYTLPSQTYSRPIRSKLGYHIVITHGERKARGELEVAQILIRNSRGRNAKQKIDSLHQLLKDGADFAALAKKHSDDKATATNGGYLGFFGINKYESIFENTAFRLREDGQISRPIRSSIGWHIIKRISHKPVGTYEELSRTLENKIKSDGRYAVAEKATLNKIKEENNYQEKSWDKALMLKELGEDYLSYGWKVPEYTNQELFSIGSSAVKADELMSYLIKNTASRLRINRTLSPADALEKLYDEFSQSKIKEYQESQLEKKYPEFKALMREYSEGILLFEATKMKVWDRASNDSMGLKNFHRKNANNYMWPSRALVENISINGTDSKIIDKVLRQMTRKSGNKLLKKFNKKAEVVKSQTVLVEKENLTQGLRWESGSMTDITKNGDNVTTLKRVVEIIPPKAKSLDEARGYVIADFQDFLEKQWVDELTEEFTVTVNQDVLASIIK